MKKTTYTKHEKKAHKALRKLKKNGRGRGWQAHE